MEKFLESLMDRLDFPPDARTVLRGADATMGKDVLYRQEVRDALADIFSSRDNAQVHAVMEKLTDLAHRAGIHPYTLHLLVLMYAFRELLEKYRTNRIPEDVYWNTVADLGYKLQECHEVYEIWGTFVPEWFAEYYRLQRFGLGRLQFEIHTFERKDYSHHGYTVHTGDRVYYVHIPSSGPLTREKRMDAYRRAYAFFRPDREGKPLVLACDSWLLYPENEQFFPRTSHILEFMHDFDIIDQSTTDSFTDAWRVFGKDYRQPLDKLPVQTSLQKAFVGWLRAGHKTGYGYGILLFDGEHIL